MLLDSNHQDLKRSTALSITRVCTPTSQVGEWPFLVSSFPYVYMVDLQDIVGSVLADETRAWPSLPYLMHDWQLEAFSLPNLFPTAAGLPFLQPSGSPIRNAIQWT